MSWTQATALLQQAMPNYRPRVNQDSLALAIEGAFAKRAHILAQAGCGTGKSYAGLVPAYFHSKAIQKPVVYATATKALQDQLANKDLPFLQTIFPDLKFAILKGRSNYVCQAKVSELESPGLQAQVERGIAVEGFSGEIDDLGVSRQDRALLSTTSEECPGKKNCPFGDVCFSEAAKQKARESHIVVVNHAVLSADLMVKDNQRAIGIPEDKITSILPNFGAVVVDEAHKMEDYVTSALGDEVTEFSFKRLATEVSNFLESTDPKVKIGAASDAIFKTVASIGAERADKRSKSVALKGDAFVKLAMPVADMVDLLTAIQGKVESTAIYNNDKKQQQKIRLARRVGSQRDRLREVLISAPEDLVRWIELGDEPTGNRYAKSVKGASIKWAPLSVANFLYEELWSRVPGVLMSATIALGDDFSFLAGRLGVDTFIPFDAGTPFDFTTQARTFIPQISHPVEATKSRWRSEAHAHMIELIRASNGRALLLFTSKSEMEEAHHSLSPAIKRMGHRVLMQGQEGTTNKELAQIFKDDEHSVLFGMESFMTGIDIQGDSLRLVVIDKLPFPVPTDVIWAARCDIIDRHVTGRGNPTFAKDGSFTTLTVPTMALTILQAYGRLIRTVEDAGVVAIMDSRLYGKTQKGFYAPRIMNALPNAPVLTDLDETVEYLKGLDK